MLLVIGQLIVFIETNFSSSGFCLISLAFYWTEFCMEAWDLHGISLWLLHFSTHISLDLSYFT